MFILVLPICALASNTGSKVARWVRSQTKHFNATTDFNGIYDCPNQGEAYSAAYLVTKGTFLRHQVGEDRLLGGQGNMEGASHAVFRRARLTKTVDLFDFFIEHLSWYERRMAKHKDQSEYIAAMYLQRVAAQSSPRSVS